MPSAQSNLRGIVMMVLATAAFVSCDTLMKLVLADLAPLQVLFIRGLWAIVWCFPLVVMLGHRKRLGMLVDKWVTIRNVCELGAVFCFVVALANMPIADITALGQLAPLLLLAGASVVFGERIGRLRMAIIGLGLVGALLVAQPTGAGFSPFALLGFGLALGSAARDLSGRKVAAEIPGIMVAFGTIVAVTLGSGAGTALFETWQPPTPMHLGLLAGAGLFLTVGHYLIFLSYRTGATGAVAPFLYMFSVWALLSGVLVFGTVPNPVAIAGMAMIVGSGIVVILIDRRRRRLVPVA